MASLMASAKSAFGPDLQVRVCVAASSKRTEVCLELPIGSRKQDLGVEPSHVTLGILVKAGTDG